MIVVLLLLGLTVLLLRWLSTARVRCIRLGAIAAVWNVLLSRWMATTLSVVATRRARWLIRGWWCSASICPSAAPVRRVPIGVRPAAVGFAVPAKKVACHGTKRAEAAAAACALATVLAAMLLLLLLLLTAVRAASSQER